MTKTEYTKQELEDIAQWLQMNPDKIPLELRADTPKTEMQSLIDRTVEKALLFKQYPELKSTLFPNLEDGYF